MRLAIHCALMTITKQCRALANQKASLSSTARSRIHQALRWLMLHAKKPVRLLALATLLCTQNTHHFPSIDAENASQRI